MLFEKDTVFFGVVNCNNLSFIKLLYRFSRIKEYTLPDREQPIRRMNCAIVTKSYVITVY